MRTIGISPESTLIFAGTITPGKAGDWIEIYSGAGREHRLGGAATLKAFSRHCDPP
jgi:hypothetical protein